MSAEKTSAGTNKARVIAMFRIISRLINYKYSYYLSDRVGLTLSIYLQQFSGVGIISGIN